MHSLDILESISFIAAVDSADDSEEESLPVCVRFFPRFFFSWISSLLLHEENLDNTGGGEEDFSGSSSSSRDEFTLGLDKGVENIDPSVGKNCCCDEVVCTGV